MADYKFLGKTSKEVFVIKGMNVFSEKWIHNGGCVTVTNPQNNKNYVLSKYVSCGVEFAAGKDARGYWMFFAER